MRLALLLGLAACASTPAFPPAARPGGFPPEARRTQPPAGVEERALAIGERAPDFTLPRAGGGSLRLSQALARGPVVLVFYRGQW